MSRRPSPSLDLFAQTVQTSAPKSTEHVPSSKQRLDAPTLRFAIKWHGGEAFRTWLRGVLRRGRGRVSELTLILRNHAQHEQPSADYSAELLLRGAVLAEWLRVDVESDVYEPGRQRALVELFAQGGDPWR